MVSDDNSGFIRRPTFFSQGSHFRSKQVHRINHKLIDIALQNFIIEIKEKIEIPEWRAEITLQ